MKRKTTKTIAWILLAVFLFMAGQTLISTVYKADQERMNPECLWNGDFAATDEFSNYARDIQGQLWLWQQDQSDAPEFWLDTDSFQYYAAKGEQVITNAPNLTRGYYEKQKYSFVLDVPVKSEDYFEHITFRNVGGELLRDSKMYFAIPESTVSQLQAGWSEQRDYLTHQLLMLLLWSALSAGMLIYVCIVAGHKPGDDELHPLRVDRVFTEIFMALIACLGFIYVVLIVRGFDSYYIFHWDQLTKEAINTTTALATATLMLMIMLAMPLIRKMKSKTFFSSSIIYLGIKSCLHILMTILRGIKGFFDGSAYKEHLLTKRLFRSQLAYICGSAILLLFFGLMSAASYSFAPMLLFGFFEILITAWYVMGNRKAYSDINAGYVESLKSQMKSENTKTALITNVSHDLKTPLTSIITYVDLLAKEDDLSETSRDYVNIIAGKAERLKHIVSDLFDLSKSVSGNIPLDLDILDLRKLMEQTLADMKDRIEGSGHNLKIDLGQEPVNIFSDGKKLYRVFQNIIDNALKYSLAGSRIFINLSSSGDKVTVAVKNTAGYEMNFTEEEILQRFTRGDESRTGEGSGLGLSIAESFTQSCGGTFDLSIDGDQFKVAVEFPTVEVTGREVE